MGELAGTGPAGGSTPDPFDGPGRSFGVSHIRPCPACGTVFTLADLSSDPPWVSCRRCSRQGPFEEGASPFSIGEVLVPVEPLDPEDEPF